MSTIQKNFIVCRASAGSGKTFKLVNEYLKLCLLSDSKFKFGKILAITFTNKAAAEMKERIIEHLRALAADKSDPNYSQSWIQHYKELTGLSEEIIRSRAKQIRESVLHNYTSLSISTIDKFTHKLIRSFARDLRLSADFEIQLYPEETLSKSTDELISLAGQDVEVTEILENYVDYLISEGSSWQVEKGIKHFGKQILDENASLHLDKLAEMSHAEFKNIFSFLNEFIKKHENKLSVLSLKFFELVNNGNIETEQFNGMSRGSQRHFITIRNREFDKSTLKFSDADKKNLDNFTFIKPKTSIDPELKNKLEKCFIHLNEILEKEHPKYIFYKLLRKNIYNLSLIKQFSNKLNEINQNENTVLIGEFNKIISDVVKNDPAPFIYERIGERYHHILIDEFQDTSVLQFNNILPLIENSLANSHKCLIVGDPKQAIYRWRGGDIDQFIQLPNLENEVSIEIKQSIKENFISEELTNNYRSGKNIVEFNNQFFQYTSASLNSEYQSIYSSLKQESKNESGYVELTLLDEDKINGDENILNFTIEKINECKNSGFNFSDITILTRNKKEGVLIAERLHELKIPVISSESLLLSGSNEVQLTMSFIRFLAYPKDQIAGFKTIELHQKFINKEDSNVYDKYRKTDSKFLFEVQKYLADQNIIYKRSDLLNHTSYQLILEVVRLFFPQSENNYLRFLVEYVYNQWKNKPVDILELCEWWEEHKDKLSIQSTEKNDAIQIMTIHGSKGLQFPVVIFPFAEWKSKNGREWLWVDLKNEEIPLKTTIVKSNASHLDQSNYSILKTEEKNKTDLDDLNLMYVALTRPETRLYLISENVNTMKRFSPFFKQSLEQNSDITWIKGKKENYTSKISSIENSFKIEYSQDKSWQDRLRLSTEKDVNKEEQEEIYLTKKSGILLHYILEKFENIKDAKEHLDLISTQDKSISKTHSSLLKEINSVYNHPFIGNLLTNKNTISECSIVDITGKTYRPDKVVLENDSVTICDFKTGAKKEEHKIQLDEYGKLFSEMKYKTIKKYLFYTKESLLLEIQ
jgi:ATP-dependent exoDNAse (exonuclease V) beta subunit